MKRAPGLVFLVAVGCSSAPQDPLAPFLPDLPPTGGAAIAAAGQLTEANYAAEKVAGPASQGLPGDYFLRNDKIRVVVQAPGRAIAPCPYGGNIIDIDRLDMPVGDQLGEVAPFLQLGRTVDFKSAEVVRDGSKGGPAVLRFRGRDVVDDYINVTGLGGLVKAIGGDYRPDIDLGLEVAVTYVLSPGATQVEVIYTLYNGADSERATGFGTITDTGAQVEIFHPALGFGEIGLNDLFGNMAGIPLVEYVALQGQGVAYGIVPVLADGAAKGAPFPISGVDVEVFDLKQAFDALGPNGQTLVVPSKMGVTRIVDVMVASDLADVERQVRARKSQAVGAIDGTVKSAGGAPVAGARVAIDAATGDPKRSIVTVAVSDGAGAFHAMVPPGDYKVQAEAEGGRRGAAVAVTVAAQGSAQATLMVGDAAEIMYKIHDRMGAPMPGKIFVVGAPPVAPERRFHDIGKDPLPRGIAGWLASREGDSSLGTRWDHPIRLVPGRYRVVVGRGPEWSRFEKTIDLGAGGAMIDATLDRVLDTTGYVACDFHQHTNISPDAPVPPADRIVTYLAEGTEVVSTSEHDVHLDYAPFVKALGAEGMLDTMVGVEVSPFDYGHFIGFPLPVAALSPNGGALDWGGGDGFDLPPAEIFVGLRKLGAKVVQVNHARAEPGADQITSFQQTFDRAGLAFDFAGRSFGGTAALQPLSSLELGLPDGAQVFSPTFDALEVYNGLTYHIVDEGGARVDPLTDNNLRDWMNFLSFGFMTTAVGNSDSHTWMNSPAGLPRTLVRVPDDSPAAIAGGVADEVVRTVAGQAPRDAIVTNTPLVTITAGGVGMGKVAAHAGGPLAIGVKVQTPSWAPVDTVEVYANATFDVPPPKGMLPTAFAPVLCFTSRAMPTQRCAAAIGGARPLVMTQVDVAMGAARFEADLSVMVDPAEIAARQRAGAQGKDLWLVARVSGEVGLFPTIPQGILDDADVQKLVEGMVPLGRGIGAFAFTNPVMVDVDGGGWRAPFAP